MASLSRICSQNYLPSWNDILHCQIYGTGIAEYLVNLSELGRFRLCDISKSAGKRPIWTRFFDDAACIVYIIDTSVFDEPYGNSSNRLEQSLRQLNKLRKDALLRRVNILVLLNKCDLLKLKIRGGAAFAAAMKDFQGTVGSYRAALRYLQDRVEKIAQDDRPRTALGAHLKARHIKTSVMNCTRADSVEEVSRVLTSLLGSEGSKSGGRLQVLQSFLHV
ncbi:hypothetical protein P389DRAFT_48512 [Cystobasidium minutum MCA 4210]|uniref:uncharacterized protein n=1 Tax=Cystobasidium minutum MCA 4210 TaxID=1397322 RepID=UPI0034CEA5F0|eukprot:jgi/Rhomi1/48512/CE48511_20